MLGKLIQSPEKSEIIAEILNALSEQWENTLIEHDTAAQVGGYIPLDDKYPSEIEQKYMRLAHEITEI